MFDITSSKLLILGSWRARHRSQDLPHCCAPSASTWASSSAMPPLSRPVRRGHARERAGPAEKGGREGGSETEPPPLGRASVDQQPTEARQDVDALMGAETKPTASPISGRRRGMGCRPRRADAGGEPPPALNGAAKPAEVAAAEPQATPGSPGQPGSAGVKTGT